MKRMVIIIVLAVIAFPLLVLGGNPENGKRLYAAKCQSCHGKKGDGKGAGGKALIPKPTDFTDAQALAGKKDADLIRAIKEGGRGVGKSPIMGAYGKQFNDDEYNDLVAYIRTFTRK